MFITRDTLKQLGVCKSGFRWFMTNFPDGGDIDKIYAGLLQDGRIDDAAWLFGATGKPPKNTAHIDQIRTFVEVKLPAMMERVSRERRATQVSQLLLSSESAGIHQYASRIML